MEIKVKVATSPSIDELIKRFKTAGAEIKPYLRDASYAVALKIEREAKILAPVLTGRLRSSIATSIGIVGDIQAIVSTNVEYAELVHEGLGYGRNSIPRPFMREAVEISADENSKIAGKIIENAFADILK